jgi:hypothetical protein
MKTHTFNSSQLKSGKFDENKDELYITFNTGKEYVYTGVMNDIWQGLISAESSGKYFNENIKRKYSYKLVS